jgi:hypothetical protein
MGHAPVADKEGLVILTFSLVQVGCSGARRFSEERLLDERLE